ncbi:MAG: hypothetical protein JXP36_07540 [Bacteroidales bacterium]|nr:hypothetical protein [Bacteroidales bacterium]
MGLFFRYYIDPTNTKYTLRNQNYWSSKSDYSYSFEDIHIYSGRNDYRLPSFHKLDAACNFTKKKEKESGLSGYILFITDKMQILCLFNENEG